MLGKSKIFQISRENGGERYTKRFNIWVHLVVMPYAVIMRFASLREITASLLEHHARIVTYADVVKRKLVSLLTNNTDFEPDEIVSIYRKRWKIELLFKQMKQNLPLKYFYGESANAIKIQIWVTLIANLLPPSRTDSFQLRGGLVFGLPLNPLLKINGL